MRFVLVSSGPQGFDGHVAALSAGELDFCAAYREAARRLVSPESLSPVPLVVTPAPYADNLAARRLWDDQTHPGLVGKIPGTPLETAVFVAFPSLCIGWRRGRSDIVGALAADVAAWESLSSCRSRVLGWMQTETLFAGCFACLCAGARALGLLSSEEEGALVARALAASIRSLVARRYPMNAALLVRDNPGAVTALRATVARCSAMDVPLLPLDSFALAQRVSRVAEEVFSVLSSVV